MSQSFKISVLKHTTVLVSKAMKEQKEEVHKTVRKWRKKKTEGEERIR
jgi:hypothetical protein